LTGALPEDVPGRAALARRKTILLPGRDRELETFIADTCPLPVDVVSNPEAPLGPFDLAVLVVDSVGPPLRAALTRVLTDNVAYVVLVRRDVWGAANAAVRKLLDEVQRDPRRKLIRFWRDREELERTLREEVFRIDEAALVGQAVRDGAFVKVGTAFDQKWELENAGFCVWEGRALKELATEHLLPEHDFVPIARTEPGQRVAVSVRFTAPGEPASCRSVWQIVDTEGRVAYPWAPGIRCQVLAVL